MRLSEEVRELEIKYKSLRDISESRFHTITLLRNQLKQANEEIRKLKTDLQLAKGREEAYRETAKECLEYKKILNTIVQIQDSKLLNYALKTYKEMM